jgi:hypothetical protein
MALAIDMNKTSCFLSTLNQGRRLNIMATP